MHTWKYVCFFGLSFLMLTASEYNKNFTPGADRFSIKEKAIVSCSPIVNNIPTALEEITINDNQKPAGEFRNGIYYINLEAREGYWYPDSKDGAPFKIKAFAETGKPLQVPGPLIRVPAGTEIRISIRNGIKGPLNLFGFTTRLYRPDHYKESAIIQEGATKEISFNAGEAGTFLYTAKDIADTLTPAAVAAPFLNSQLYGAFIIDPANEKINRKERIFMISMCGIKDRNDIMTRYVINGLSWPHTERLSYKQGEKVDWRVINASVLGHPMHLHGFPFIINSFIFPSAAKDSVIPEEKRKPIVTQNLIPMNRMRITWVPEKEGNWLFHCHLLDHTLPASFFGDHDFEGHAGMNIQTHAQNGMGGLIMGIQVQPDKKLDNQHRVKTTAERKLTLLIGEQPQNYSNNKSGKGFQLLEKGMVVSKQYSIPGPPIILTKNQPVAIKIINNLKEATTIHWHGLVVDSYYDGVAGWGNEGNKLAPLIQPGDSFIVHITPSQAGTYMYHTHMHDRQVLDGLYGALIVMDPGEKYNPKTDKIFLISQGGSNMAFTKNWMTGFGNLHYLLNGNNQPDEMDWKRGTKYHIRVINISSQQNSYFTSPRSGFEISLKKDNKPVTWKVTGKDGWLYPAKLFETIPANNQRAAPGTTHDFEFTPDKTGDYRFEAKMDEVVVVTQIIKVGD
ncbi:MAG TPA: multicopper oxidase domain-containing protein [Chitinophagaceae bacterium]|nr:multicopper oxidase domain-containing protein [Chitinophagaceae bacterium]